CDCNSYFGETDFNGIFEAKIPIYGVIGDSQGALYAQKCTDIGMAKATYGTGTSILVNTGDKAISKQDALGLVTAIAWSISGQVSYALEGIINCSGDTLNWLKELGLFESSKEIEPLCLSVDDNDGVYLVPALVGYGIPYWKSDARASLSGMTRATTKAHLVRAGAESIVYQIYDAIKAMEKSSGITISSLRVDGGATVNQFLMQFQADILGMEVIASKVQELSAMGAYYMAANTLWKKDTNDEEESHLSYQPKMSEEKRNTYLDGWQKAVVKCLSEGD
ncbi:MAG: glycerol kinase, partial [Vallitaleaceae bacterium]|nr:glycerol kinase [Vallitaleaceae bacterium]